MVGSPVIASPIVYDKLIQHGVTGLLAQSEQEWVRSIVKLVKKPQLRRRMGAALRGEVLRHHDIHKQAWRWMAAYRTTRA
jgi:glycosyltransferase involved in cell wall biosynthesis